MGRASWHWYLIGLAIVVVVVAGLAELSVQSSSCMACHQQEAAFSDWMRSRLKAEKKGFSHELIACADCHMKGGAARTVGSRLEGMLHAVTYLVPQLDPRKPMVSALSSTSKAPTENCQYCHLAAINRKSVRLKDLPSELMKIGLVMDHRKHVLARDDTCAKCHERYKEKSAPDKAVAYTEVNHLACDSCHTRASHSYRTGQIKAVSEAQFLEARQEAWNQLSKNPRWMIAMPSEQSCRRCHSGKIHYKTPIFLADCRDGKKFEDCVKCHPLMTKEYFEQYRRNREQRSLALDTDLRTQKTE